MENNRVQKDIFIIFKKQKEIKDLFFIKKSFYNIYNMESESVFVSVFNEPSDFYLSTFIYSMVGSFMVGGSFLTKNFLQEYGVEKKVQNIFKIVSLVLSIIGVILITYSMAFSYSVGIKTFVSIIGGVLMIVSFILADTTKLSLLYEGLFHGGIGLMSIASLSDRNVMYSFMSQVMTILLLISRHLILYQQENKIVNGFGIPLSIISITGLNLANSMFLQTD